VTEPIRPIGRPDAAGPAPVPAVRRLTAKEREEAARERERRRGRRPAAPSTRVAEPPPEGGGSVDVRA
jgi:ribosome assembly protein YihI (activator of Der GTPase)